MDIVSICGQEQSLPSTWLTSNPLSWRLLRVLSPQTIINNHLRRLVWLVSRCL